MKYLLPILCLFVFSCDDDGENLEDCTSFLNNDYYCEDYRIIEDLFDCEGQECLQYTLAGYDNSDDNGFDPYNSVTWLSDFSTDYQDFNLPNRVINISIESISISSIPDNITDLEYLIFLRVKNNQLMDIPENICEIDGLPNEYCSLDNQGFLCSQQDVIIDFSNNNLCEEYHYDCIDDFDNQDQSNCP